MKNTRLAHSGVQKKTIVSKDDSVIYYEVHPGSSEKPTLFFVHGIGGDTDGWQFVREHILKEKGRTISMDVRGHGYSHHPTHASGYKLERIEEDIAAIITKEKLEKPILVGHSGGAIIAAKFASAHPEILGGLVLIAGSYCPPPYLSSPFLRAIVSAGITIGGIISPPPAGRFTRRGGWHSPYPVGKHHKEVEVYGLLRTMFYNSLRSYLYTSKALITLDLRDKLKHISVPTLLIAGEHDGIFPKHISETMEKEIPNATLVVLENANHVSILNNSMEVAYAILHFLRF